MNDYDAIKQAVFHYYEGYRDKSRERLERAFALEVATMTGYIKNKEGKLEFFSMTMKDAIEQWVASDYTPFECAEGIMLAVDIFSSLAATVVFDFGGKYLESYQLVKIDESWLIVSKFIVNR